MGATTCTSCGMPLAAGKQFCTNCGARVGGPSGAPTGPAPTGPGPTAPAAAATAPVSASGPPTAEPATQPLQTTDPRGNRQWRAVAVAGIVALIVGIVAAVVWPAEAGELVADAPIGPSGGTIPFEDGGELRVPRGAVSSTQRITVRKTTTREPAQIGTTTYPPGSLIVYLFGPLTIDFRRPVELLFPIPEDADGARIYVIRDGRLTLIAVVRNDDGRARVVVTGFRDGRMVVRT